MDWKKWLPTQKVVASAVTGFLTIAGLAVESDGWDKPENAALITLAIALAGAYFKTDATSP